MIASWYSTTDFKPILPLIGVVVGWILGQGAELFRTWKRKRRLKNALYQELQDVGRWLATARKAAAVIIQLLAHKRLANEIPVAIPTHVFDAHFAEICIDLNEAERIAFAAVYANVKNLNSNRELFEKLWRESAGDPDKLTNLAYVADSIYLRSSRAWLQSKSLWEKKAKVSIEEELQEDSEIPRRLEELKRIAKERSIKDILEDQ